MSDLHNPKIILVLAPATSGKTFCLRNIGQFCKEGNKAFHINCDRKPLPFRPKGIVSKAPSSAMDVLAFIDQAEASEKVDVIVIDTVTQLGTDYVAENVVTADDTRKAWGDYKSFLDNLMTKIKSGKKIYVVLAHEDSVLDEDTGIVTRRAPFQGGFSKIGLEAHFTNIIGCAVVKPSKVDPKIASDLYTVNEDEKLDDMKYVFQTRKTAGTMGVAYRAPMGMWERNETYIDNDIAHVLHRIDEYYSEVE